MIMESQQVSPQEILFLQKANIGILWLLFLLPVRPQLNKLQSFTKYLRQTLVTMQ